MECLVGDFTGAAAPPTPVAAAPATPAATPAAAAEAPTTATPSAAPAAAFVAEPDSKRAAEDEEELDWLKEASVLDDTGNVTGDVSALGLDDDDDVPDWLKD